MSVLDVFVSLTKTEKKYKNNKTMYITKQPTDKFMYAFVYDFNYEILNFCRNVKAKYGTQQFTFSDKAWRFNNLDIATLVRERFPEVIIDKDVLLDIEKFDLEKKSLEMRVKKAEELKKATDTDFVIKNIKGELYPYQKIGVEFFVNNNGTALLADAPGVGKQNSVNTKIMTPTGWKKMGDLSIGDTVFGRNGKPTKIIGIYPQGKKELYRFTLTDGSSCLCGKEHLWKVRNRNRIKRKQGWDILNTETLLNRKLKNPDGRSAYMIPFAEPINFKKRIFKIKPYTIGALIGDGALTCSSIYISIPKIKSNVLKRIKKEHPEYEYRRNNLSIAFTNGNKGRRKNKMLEAIRELKLNVKSKYRFIPEEYKKGSVEQKIALLNGLMDTDGSSYKNRISFCTTSEKLANDVIELVRSLSGEAKIHKYDRRKENKPIEYKVNIKLDKFCPFSEDNYKAKRWWKAKNRGAGRYIESIVFEKIDDAVCIAVDNDEHLYIVEDYIVTHNTAQALAYVAHNKIEKTLVVCPAVVKGAWSNEVKKWTKLTPYVIDSKTKLTLDVISEYDVFIINYDILAKFLKVLTTARFGSLILDESQYIKSPTAKRTKCVKLISKNIPSVLLLSGTPMLNRPIELFNSLTLIDPANWCDYYHFATRYCNGHQGTWGFDASGASNIKELQQKISPYFLRRTKDDVLKELPPKTFVDMPIQLENGVREQYDYAERSFMEYLREIKEMTTDEINRSLSAEKLVKLGELRQLTTMGKIATAKEVIQNIIDSGEKIVVFSVYNAPLEELKEHFKEKAVLIIGSTKEADRNNAITDFQNKEEVSIFLGGMKSAGVGITLTAAPNVLLIDYPWVPADTDQAIDRIHRPGQTATHATIYQLVASNTIDQKMQVLLEGKRDIFNQLIENKVTKIKRQTSLIKDLIKEYAK